MNLAPCGTRALRLVLTLLLLTGCASTSALSTGSPAPVPLQEELRPLQHFVGKWRCVSSTLDLTYTVQPELGGAFLAGEVTVRSVSSHEVLPLAARDSWGFDSVTHEYFRAYRDSDGTFGIVRSKGWEGDHLVFEGDAVARGERVPLRETIDRAGPDRMNAVWASRKSGGDWKVYSDEVCTRMP